MPIAFVIFHPTREVNVYGSLFSYEAESLKVAISSYTSYLLNKYPLEHLEMDASESSHILKNFNSVYL